MFIIALKDLISPRCHLRVGGDPLFFKYLMLLTMDSSLHGNDREYVTGSKKSSDFDKLIKWRKAYELH